MLACDAARCALVAVMSGPGVLLPALAALQGTIALLDAPFTARTGAPPGEPRTRRGHIPRTLIMIPVPP